MAIGAECNGIGDLIRAVMGQLDHVMDLKKRESERIVEWCRFAT